MILKKEVEFFEILVYSRILINFLNELALILFVNEFCEVLDMFLLYKLSSEAMVRVSMGDICLPRS